MQQRHPAAEDTSMATAPKTDWLAATRERNLTDARKLAATAAAYGNDNPEHHAQIRAEVVTAVRDLLREWDDA